MVKLKVVSINKTECGIKTADIQGNNTEVL